MERETYYHDYVYVIHDFLSKRECDDLIQIAEVIGFNEAPVTTSQGPVMQKDLRNNSRIIKDDHELAKLLWSKALPWVVPTWKGWEAVGLNERFRFYRYEVGEKFAPHYDGAFRREDGDRSHFTFLIYLNNDFVGGETRFYEPQVFNVLPRVGSLLIFHHPQLHEGVAIERGTKYVLRSDVMYRRVEM